MAYNLAARQHAAHGCWGPRRLWDPHEHVACERDGSDDSWRRHPDATGWQRSVVERERRSKTVRDKLLPPSTSFFVKSRTLMGCTDPLRRGVGAPHQCPLESAAGYLCHFILYADVRLHVPMTHRNDTGTVGRGGGRLATTLHLRTFRT